MQSLILAYLNAAHAGALGHIGKCAFMIFHASNWPLANAEIAQAAPEIIANVEHGFMIVPVGTRSTHDFEYLQLQRQSLYCLTTLGCRCRVRNIEAT